MKDTAPNSFMRVDSLGVISLLPDDGRAAETFQSLKNLGLPTYSVENTASAPWTLPQVTDILSEPKWKQLLIYTQSIGAFETALVAMALEVGFEVYIAVEEIETSSESRLSRLRQLSAFVISPADALEDLLLAPN
ncbi:MAG: hypothetical protein AAGJ50_01850 [Pseudomonadota bacterium]